MVEPNSSSKDPMPIFWALLLWSSIGIGLGLIVEIVFAQMAAGAWIWEGLNLDSTTWFDVSRSTITTVGIFGVGGAALLAYRRQHTTERQHSLDERKQGAEDKADLRARYTTAAEQLGHEKPAVRLAGVYAMAALADDWHSAEEDEQRRICIDVLCAYLRMEYVPEPEGAKTGEKEVRQTVIKVIANHLLDPSNTMSWCDISLDFTGAVFDGGDFSGAKFTGGDVNFTAAAFIGGSVAFDAAEFSGGNVDFRNARFSGGEVNFTGAEFIGGNVTFDAAEFNGGNVNFSNAHFADGTVSFFKAAFISGLVNFSRSEVRGSSIIFTDTNFTGGNITFSNAKFTGGNVTFSRAKFTKGGISFGSAAFSSGIVNFNGATFATASATFAKAKFIGGVASFAKSKFVSGSVSFEAAAFTGGRVSFDSAEFDGATVSFLKAQGSGPAVVSFENVASWEYPPKFSWAQGSSPTWVLPSL
ncbi:pentapeptide repeat-containing protein [Arthrobacter sp. zg-Y179]|uniref:pentapeptide repeat-containing protein n=1 Tax=Arthrobacter sp. zg-Y179 TaxID=2894188 RepID=UPI001E54114E|nr:pentapeptide repeat-containing protein [Arthrobacter sp. zg-Y179]MCC9175847.1 pentapeptide repeat-containing protein [Arthrobacter sp. zg-Y179]